MVQTVTMPFYTLLPLVTTLVMPILMVLLVIYVARIAKAVRDMAQIAELYFELLPKSPGPPRDNIAP